MKARCITWTEETGPWSGEFQGAGSQVSIIFNRLERPGEGPELHRHPYAETFLVRKGRIRFTVGEATLDVPAGRIVVVPAGVPHRFTSLSDEAEMIDIHASGRFVTEWLQAPTAS
ncbi:cupin domain-containing protein [Sphingosinicella sp. CPCC 101087]|uniref:cupin domain-containing protein n=1 Tax=Sphingosinicella sp. CPCC 101087 TaxID=2497754 RepID=UPI00101B9FDA|nr:cupin domain-containing protein [Sphingosinicella sp. CPCC 101087]